MSLLLQRGIKVKCSNISKERALDNTNYFILTDIMCDTDFPYRVEGAHGVITDYKFAVAVEDEIPVEQVTEQVNEQVKVGDLVYYGDIKGNVLEYKRIGDPSCVGTITRIYLDDEYPYCIDYVNSGWRYVLPAEEEEQTPFHTAETGAQKDLSTKPRIDLIPSEMIEGLAEVLTYGAAKYDDNNWRKGLNNSVHYAAAMRHLLKYWKGIDLDEESGLHHLKHALVNLGMLVTNIDRPELDDRYEDKS